MSMTDVTAESPLLQSKDVNKDMRLVGGRMTKCLKISNGVFHLFHLIVLAVLIYYTTRTIEEISKKTSDIDDLQSSLDVAEAQLQALQQRVAPLQRELACLEELKHNVTVFAKEANLAAAEARQLANKTLGYKNSTEKILIAMENLNLTVSVQTLNATQISLNSSLEQLTLMLAKAVPIGTMFDFAGLSVPPGFLVCDGSVVRKAKYSLLYGAIGDAWGKAGSDMFVLPNMTRRVAMGSGGTLEPNSTIGSKLGMYGGEERHRLTTDENGPHTHLSGWGVNSAQKAPYGCKEPYNHVGGHESDLDNCELYTSPAGKGQPHNIVQPSAIVWKIIKVN